MPKLPPDPSYIPPSDEEINDMAQVNDATLADAKADARRHDDLAAFLEADQVEGEDDE